MTEIRCAYCRRMTAENRQAGGIWDWPGRGTVTVCVSCSLTDAELAERIEALLTTEPTPFTQIVKRAGRKLVLAFTDPEIMKGLRELESMGCAVMTPGRGWSI